MRCSRVSYRYSSALALLLLCTAVVAAQARLPLGGDSSFGGRGATTSVGVTLGGPASTTAPNFLGVNIDTASLYQGYDPHRLDFKDPGLVELGAAFAAAGEGKTTLRIGGSTADDAGWGAAAAAPGNPHQPSPGSGPKYSQHVVIDEAYWDEIITYAANAGFDIAWDLNALRMRTASNTWNTTFAADLLGYVAARPEQAAVLRYVQLGNEPGHSMVETPGAPTPEQHGRDFIQLRRLLNQTFSPPGKHVAAQRPMVQGPDVCFGLGFMGPGGFDKCANLSYFEKLLVASDGTIEEITVHNYGLSGPSWNATSSSSHSTYIPHQCTVANLLDPTTWEENFTNVLAGWRETQQRVAPSARLILSESATTGDGGCVNMSNTFIAGFYWIAELAIVSRLGYWKAYRQDFVGFSGIGGGSSYALAGPPGWVGGGGDRSITEADYRLTTPRSPMKINPPPSAVDASNGGEVVRMEWYGNNKHETQGVGTSGPPHVGPWPTGALVANPDYYTSVLWKRLLSPRILKLDVTPTDVLDAELVGNKKIRFAAACARNSATTLTGGGVVIAYSNPTSDSTLVTTTVADHGKALPSTPRREWFLTSGGKHGGSPESFLLSRVMLLNGIPLNHTSLKPGGMEGHWVAKNADDDQDGIVVGPWSYGYILLEDVAAASLCEAQSWH